MTEFINPKTKLFCVLANPAGHSLSPRMHNAGFRALEFNAVYLAFAPSNLSKALVGLREVQVSGFNISTPFKQEVCGLLDELDPRASLLGASNTVVNCNGKLKGFNTDGEGAVFALQQKGVKLSGKKVVVFGAGPAAQSIALSFKQAGAIVTLANRTIDKAENAVSKLGLDAAVSLVDVSTVLTEADGVVNATSFEGQLCDETLLDGKEFALEVNYGKTTWFSRISPSKTRVFASGRELLLGQGVKAFELFTGLQAPVDAMAKALEENIVLIGFMGSGKTSVGKALAAELNKQFADTDELFEQKQRKTIAEIFEEKGESGFREIESQVIASVMSNPGQVVAVGGGAVLSEENRRLIQREKVFYLHAAADDVLKRLENDVQRPLLASKSPAQVQSLFDSRLVLYEKTCRHVVETSGKSIEQIASEIQKLC